MCRTVCRRAERRLLDADTPNRATAARNVNRLSGFWPGMTLACVVGDCGDELWARLGDGRFPPIG